MSQERKRSRRNLLIAMVAVAIVFVVLLVPAVPVDTTYEETHRDTYEVVSANQTDNFNETKAILGYDYLVYDIAVVEVKNNDSYGGTFTATFDLPYWFDAGFTEPPGKNISNYIEAGQTAQFTAEFDTHASGVQAPVYLYIEYSVLAPTVIVTRHRTVYKSVIQLLIGA